MEKKKILQISRTFFVNKRQFSFNLFFLILPNTEKHEKLFLRKVFYRNKQNIALVNLQKRGLKKNTKEETNQSKIVFL